jgi:enamine deaminase RidA (YjgF/YER057c/UK114 family)
MRKTSVLPTWRESRADDIDGPKSAYATVTEHADYRRVLFSGGLAVGPDTVAEQARTVLDRRREALTNLGGSMDDVVRTRYGVRAEHLSRETQAEVHAARDAFFERPHYPASTMVGAADLLHE